MRLIHEYKKISHAEAKKMIDSISDIIILDVRTEEEKADGYIDGSILIPNDEINEKAESVIKDKHSLILVYCRSGRRSREACFKLLNMGYDNVYDFGGIMDWPFEIVM